MGNGLERDGCNATHLKRAHRCKFFMEIAKTRPPETIANMAIVLIKQADFLLFRQLKTLSDKFKNEGGFSERMTRIRISERNKK